MFDAVFKNSGLSLERLRKLCEVAEEGSIAGAVNAHDRGSQAAYSKDIAQLESYFNHDLFVTRGAKRSGKHLGQLTPRGEALRKLAIEFFEGLEAIIEFEEDVSELRMGAGETVLQWIICAHMTRIREAFPAIKLVMKNQSSSATIQELIKGKLDVGIVENHAFANLGNDALNSYPLGEVTFALFLTPALRDQFLASSADHILTNLPIAGLEGIGPSVQQLQQTETQFGYPFHFGALLTSFPQITQAMREGGMAGFLPLLAKDDAERHGLVMLEHEYLNHLSVSISLVWNADTARYRPFLSEASSRLHRLLTAK